MAANMRKRGKTSKQPIPPVPLGLRGKRRYTFREIDVWMKSLGAKPISPKRRARLIASGNWGMPSE